MERGIQSHNECLLVLYGCGTIFYKGNIKELLPNYSLLLLGLCARWLCLKSSQTYSYLWYGIPKKGRDRNADLKNAIQSINEVLKTEPDTLQGFSGTLFCLCHYLPSQTIEMKDNGKHINGDCSIYFYSVSFQSRFPLRGLILLVIIVYLELVVEK